jgi:hypothetical protein
MSEGYWRRFKMNLNTDNAKEFCDQYYKNNLTRAKFSACIYEPAKDMIKRMYEEVLVTKAVNEVVFLGGGSASGKSVYNYYVEPAPGVLTVDGTLSSYDEVRPQVDRALKLHKHVRIVYVYCPVELAINFALKRAIKMGRTIALEVLAKTHFFSQKTFLRLYRELGTHRDVMFAVLNNTDFETPSIQPPEFLIEREYDLLDDVFRTVNDTFDNECIAYRQNGREIPRGVEEAFRKVGRPVVGQP